MGTDLSTHGDPKRGIDNSFRCFGRICTPPPLCISCALVQATVGVGTVLIWDLILIRYQM